jgi:hypothetical protein
MHRSGNSRLRRLLPPGDCRRWTSPAREVQGEEVQAHGSRGELLEGIGSRVAARERNARGARMMHTVQHILEKHFDALTETDDALSAARALLKAADLCGAQPQLAARLMAERGLTSYEHGLQMLQSIQYGKWREFDPEDALRFFALRMQEVGVVKSSPQKIIAQGTDWRFLNQLRKELKA